eukprot:gene1719-32604_t
MLLLLLLLAARLLAAASSQGKAQPPSAVRCVTTGTTSTSVAVEWDSVGGTDLYLVSVLSNDKLRPVLIKTTPSNRVILEDALPNTAYRIAVQAHPTSAPAIVQGWGDPSKPIQCKTTKLKNSSARGIRRKGTLESSRIQIEWEPPVETGSSSSSRLGGGGMVRWRKVSDDFLHTLSSWESMSVTSAAALLFGKTFTFTARPTEAAITELDSDSSYAIAVDHEGSGTWSDPVRFATAPLPSAAIVTSEVYRVSEGTHAIDLLENHNSGDLLGEAAFLTDSGNFVVPWQQLQSDPCAAAINSSTSCKAGGKDSCMACLSLAWLDAKPSHPFKQACSDPGKPWPFDNKIAEAFCGMGFSFFDWTATPVTEYCIQRVATNVGFAEYLSCNAPEASVVHNNPDDPVCICACYADRMIGEQTVNAITPHCGRVNSSSFVYPQCNCSKGSVLMPPDSPSISVMGALEVQCPYFYYVIPEPSYSLKTPCGMWFSHPKRGSCNYPNVSSPRKLGQGCTWERLPTAKVVYGDDLLESGWDRSSSFDDKTGNRKDTTNQTLANAHALTRALLRTQKPIFSPRCCGC